MSKWRCQLEHLRVLHVSTISEGTRRPLRLDSLALVLICLVLGGAARERIRSLIGLDRTQAVADVAP